MISVKVPPRSIANCQRRGVVDMGSDTYLISDLVLSVCNKLPDNWWIGCVEISNYLEDGHRVVDPVNTLKWGVFVGGCAVGSKDIRDSVTEAIGAPLFKYPILEIHH